MELKLKKVNIREGYSIWEDERGGIYRAKAGLGKFLNKEVNQNSLYRRRGYYYRSSSNKIEISPELLKFFEPIKTRNQKVLNSTTGEEEDKMKINRKEWKERIESGEIISVTVSPKFFEEGDYSKWADQYPQVEDLNTFLVRHFGEVYDRIVITSDGCVYGVRGGISHDIDYGNFRDVETFLDLVEEYGIEEQ